MNLLVPIPISPARLPLGRISLPPERCLTHRHPPFLALLHACSTHVRGPAPAPVSVCPQLVGISTDLPLYVAAHWPDVDPQRNATVMAHLHAAGYKVRPHALQAAGRHLLRPRTACNLCGESAGPRPRGGAGQPTYLWNRIRRHMHEVVPWTWRACLHSASSASEQLVPRL